ncbi:MAG: 1-acyl-sn-glycerol-3-phosphate acyltransferase [Paracoccaceae bacterium]
MTQVVEVPLWFFILIVVFATVTFASHFLFPSVRWYFRRRLERAVAKLNTRLARPIEPFKLARRTDMIQRLIYDPQVTEAIVEDARKRGEREDVAFERARQYAREIVPSFSAFAYFGFGIRAARLLANMLYDVKTGSGNTETLKRIPEDATVVFIMNHRSNMDYVLVTYLAARSSALSYAVGEWARVWPLSRLIKSMGAYFIRRKSRGALYRRVLARYVQMATAGGVTQAIFPEGGLSLDGQLMPPKMGLLAYVVSEWTPDTRDVAFVPVAINYDRVLEDRVLAKAAKTGQRRFGVRISVLTGFIVTKLWATVTGRFHKFGQAGVVFGEPLMLSAQKDPQNIEALADDLLHRIGQQMPVLGVPLVATVLLQAGAAQTEDQIKTAAASWTKGTKSQPLEGEKEAFDAMVEGALKQMESRELIEKQEGSWSMNPAETDLIRYYANSLANCHSADLAVNLEHSARAKS